MSKKVLITGAGGFVGHHFVEHFLKNTDWKVVGTDSFRHKGESPRLMHLLKDPQYKDRLDILTHDLTTPFSVREIDQLGAVDYIINQASQSHVDRSIEDPLPFIKNNVDIVLNMAELARQIKPKFFLQQMTDEIFGPAVYPYAHTEWDILRPSNPYAASKASQGCVLFSFWRCYQVPVVLINSMNMVGERQDVEKFIPLCISKILKEETIKIHGSENMIGTRMYIHARNLADAFLYIIQNTTPKAYVDDHTIVQEPDCYNVAGQQEINNLEMAKTIATILNKKLNYEMIDFHAARPGHDRRYALDNSKITKLGWTPKVNLHDSLEKLVLWTAKPENKMWLK